MGLLQRTFFFIVTLATMTNTESTSTTTTITTPLTQTLSPATKSRAISPPCAEGWESSSKTKSCYFIPRTKSKKDKKSWNQAKQACSEMVIGGREGGSGSSEGSNGTIQITPRLVDITSAEEQKFLEETITTYGFMYVQLNTVLLLLDLKRDNL